MEKDQKTLKKGILWNIVGLVFRSARFIYFIVFSRMLGQEEFGQYILAFSVMETLSKISILGAEFGAVKVVNRLKAKKDGKKYILSSIHQIGYLSLLISLVFTVVGYGLAPWFSKVILQKEQVSEMMRLFILCIPVLCLLNLLSTVSRASLNMKYENYLRSFIEPTGILIFGFLALWFQLGVSYFVFAHFVSYSIACILLLFALPHAFSSESKEKYTVSWSPFMKESVPLGLLCLLGTLKVRVDYFLVGRFLSLADVGLYSVVIEIVNVLGKIRSVVDPIAGPMFNSIFYEEDKGRFEKTVKEATRIGLIALLGIGGTLFFIPELILSLFGKDYVSGALILKIILCAQIFYVLTGLLEQVLYFTKYVSTAIAISLMSIGVLYVLLSTLIVDLGLLGVAYAVLITYIFSGLSLIFSVKKHFQFFPFDKSHFKIFSVFIFLLSSVYMAKILIPNAYQEIASGGMFLVLYSSVLFFLRKRVW